MRASILSLFAAAATATAVLNSTEAPVVSNNPKGASFLAKLPTKEDSPLQGSVSVVSNTDGKGVLVSVSISGLPAEGGPFMYHVHEKPVPADGNCTGTGAHLDPYQRGDKTPCDATTPQNCQTGDLSGKHGNITEQSFSADYSDLYLATSPSDASYLGNLSIVVHTSNKTRIRCANFSLVASDIPNTNNTTVASGIPNTNNNTTVATSSGYALPTGINATAVSTGTPTGTPISPTATSSPPQSSSGAQKLVSGPGALVALGFAALML